MRLEGETGARAGLQREKEAVRRLAGLVLMPYGDDRILVADRGPDNPHAPFESPLYLYDGTKLVPFHSEADQILREHRLTIGQV